MKALKQIIEDMKKESLPDAEQIGSELTAFIKETFLHNNYTELGRNVKPLGSGAWNEDQDDAP